MLSSRIRRTIRFEKQPTTGNVGKTILVEFTSPIAGSIGSKPQASPLPLNCWRISLTRYRLNVTGDDIDARIEDEETNK